MRQIAKITHNGTYTVLYDEKAKRNPYIIRKSWIDLDENIIPHKRTKIIARYADKLSCVFRMFYELTGHEAMYRN